MFLEITTSALHTCSGRTHEPRLLHCTFLILQHAGMLQFCLAWLPRSLSATEFLFMCSLMALENILITVSAGGLHLHDFANWACFLKQGEPDSAFGNFSGFIQGQDWQLCNFLLFFFLNIFAYHWGIMQFMLNMQQNITRSLMLTMPTFKKKYLKHILQ